MKHCTKCNKDFSDNKKYCDTCGKELKTKVEKEHHTKKEKDTYKFSIAPGVMPWLVIGVLLVIAGIILLPTKVLSYQIEVPYIDKETYTVQVPYEDVEEYTVTVPYETEETYIETIPVEEQESYQVTECAFLGLFCEGVTKYRTVTNYKDIVKTKTVTKYREETRYRTVPKTRTETREREVRKTRTETKQKEVNWIFGFDAIIEFRNLS